MRFKVTFQFITGERAVVKARGKKLCEAINEEHLQQRRNNDNETRKHTAYVDCETFNTEELICNDPFWDGLFLTPEKAFFHKLWMLEQEERLQKLRCAMKKLTKSQRKLIRQVYYKNMKFKAIAALEGRSIQAVHSQHWRVINFLRSQF